MEPPVIATASAGIFIFSLIGNWLTRRFGRKDKGKGPAQSSAAVAPGVPPSVFEPV